MIKKKVIEVTVKKRINSNFNIIEAPIADFPEYFTQFNVSKTLSIAYGYERCIILKGSFATLYIDSIKIVNTIEGTSLEGQNLTGKKLLVSGFLKAKIYFIDKTDFCPNSYFYKKIPFNSFIIVPKEITDTSHIKLQYEIEDITSTLLNKEKLFITAAIFLQYIYEN